MTRATFVAVTVEGSDSELRNVLEGILEKYLTQTNGAVAVEGSDSELKSVLEKYLAQTNGAEADTKEQAAQEPSLSTQPATNTIDLEQEVDYQYWRVSWLARKALWIMALNSNGVTSRQLQQKLGVDPQGLSGVLSAIGRIRKTSALHLDLYTKHWTEQGLTYKMSSEIAAIIIILVHKDEYIRDWDPSLL